jgi:hypothetical protein
MKAASDLTANNTNLCFVAMNARAFNCHIPANTYAQVGYALC